MPGLDTMDALLASRLQFAATITLHILFPAISLGLAWVLLYFKLRHAGTGKEYWLEAYRFWVRIFALSFAIGVVTGVSLGFQFATHWPGFMQTVGNIARPLLAYEVLTALFLEMTFLGIMLFGMSRVSNRTHTLATVVVAVGTTLSAFWVLALSSWMQTPAGYEMIDGQAHPTRWLAVIFNPSFPYRFTHMLLACGLTAGFMLAGISAYRWRRGDGGNDVKATLRTGVFLAAGLIPVQMLVGNLHGANTLAHQPAKIAAIEGVWKTGRQVPAVLFAWPDEKARQNRYEISIPGLASLSLGHAWDAELKGLDDFHGYHPPVAPVFFAFRLMVGIGLLMLVVSWLAAWQIRSRGMPGRKTSRTLVAMSFAGWIALVAGWYVTEIGRQPWLVSGLLTTPCASSGIPPGQVGMTLAISLGLYVLLPAAFVVTVFYLARRAGGPAPPARALNPLIDA